MQNANVPLSMKGLKLTTYQWRRQTIKSGSAFKGQLYFQVGQMEGPTVPSDSREAQSAFAPAAGGGVGLGKSTVAPLHGELWAMPQKKFSKTNFEIACFLHFLQTEMVSSAASARQFRLGCNHTIPVIATILGLCGSSQIR